MLDGLESRVEQLIHGSIKVVSFFEGRVRPLSEIIGSCLNHAESSGSAGAGDYRGTQQLGAGAENDKIVFCHRRHLFCNEQFRPQSFHKCSEKFLVGN